MVRALNLMPAAAVRRQALREATSFWSKVLGVSLLAMGGFISLQAWRAQEARQVRDALEAQHAPVNQVRNDTRLLRSRIASLSDTEQLALELAKKQPMVTLVGRIAEAVAYAGGDLYVDSLDFARRESTSEASEMQLLQLEGAARDNLSVTRFVEGLRSSGLFRDVQLTSTESRVLASQAATAFNLECVF